ncbi:MAG: class I SAM-dependent methyltransferase [Elusimicrobiota bacterium]
MDIGHSTLQLVEEINKYSSWIYSKFFKYIKGKVLEVGCGLGTITQFYVNDFDVTAADISDEYVNIVKQRFHNCKNFHSAVLNIESETDILQENGYNTIISSNVLEHIQNDVAALRNMNKVLKDGGVLILLVPACRFLFSNLDKNVGHYRRYSKLEIKNKLEDAGFIIEKQFYINIFGALGWFFNGKILKRKTLESLPLSLFNFFVPLFIFIESIIKIPFGLSIINICKKTK